MINPLPFRFLTDIIAASYRTADLTASAATLAGTPGSTTHPGLLHALVGGDGSTGNTEYGSGDDGAILALDPVFSKFALGLTPDAVNADQYNPVIAGFNAYLQGLGSSNFSDLNTYASYQNGVALDSFLLHPNIAYLWWLWTGKKAGLRLAPGNVFAPLTTFGTVAVGASAACTFSTVGSILTANDVPDNLQGCTPAPNVSALITTVIGGTLTITVTGTGRTSAGMLVSGRTWTGVLSSAALGAVIALTPSVAGDRIASVTGVTGAGAAGSGAFTLQSVIERVVS